MTRRSLGREVADWRPGARVATATIASNVPFNSRHGCDASGVGHPYPVERVVTHSLVFDSLMAGRYELYVRPSGPVRLTATVRGAEVTQLHWPGEGELDIGYG